ncbi:MAG: OmpH family outer membrane protein [Alphaproteobacteria bacterium]
MTPTTKRLLIAGLAVAAVLIIGGVVTFLLLQSSPSGTASAPGSSIASAPSGPTPEPRILVIDRATILRQSAAGKDMIAQVDALTKAAETEFKGEEQRLRNDAGALQQQSAVLAPEVRAQRTRDINARQQVLQTKVQDRQNQIQAGVYKARKEIEDALGPILEQIMAERGANFLVDRNAVVLGTVDVDITGIAIQRLDQKISRVKVDLIDPATLGAQLQPNTARPASPQ